MENNIFRNNNLKEAYLKKLLDKFWFAPCDAYLRAPEVAIWRGVKPKHPVLDVGCGDGRMDRYLFPHFKIDVGLDADKKAVELARKTNLYGKVLLAKSSDTKLKRNHFASVISNSTFEHIKDDIDTLKEINRVLRKDGDFIITTTTDNFLKTMRKLGLKGQKLKKYNKRVEHFHYHSVKEWEDMLKNKGFKVIFARTYFPPTVMKYWWYLFQLTTLKVYKRELWSYLKDSPYGKLFPAKVISGIYYRLLLGSYKRAFDEPGSWIFIWAKKI